MARQSTQGLQSAFLFSEDIFLPTEPMTDEEFAQFVLIADDEIPIEEVHFDLGSDSPPTQSPDKPPHPDFFAVK